jgi:hypothetical protein
VARAEGRPRFIYQWLARSAEIVVGRHARRGDGPRRRKPVIETSNRHLGAPHGFGGGTMQVTARFRLRIAPGDQTQFAFPCACAFFRCHYYPAVHLASPPRRSQREVSSPWRLGHSIALSACVPPTLEHQPGMKVPNAAARSRSRTRPQDPRPRARRRGGAVHRRGDRGLDRGRGTIRAGAAERPARAKQPASSRSTHPRRRLRPPGVTVGLDL